MSFSGHGVYPSDDGQFSAFASRRSVVHGTKGIVSTTSPLATEAGLQVLRLGGNAADAAVAAAAVLNLVDPSMTGIGGDAFSLYYEAGKKKVHALNGSGRSPRSVTLEDVCRDLGITDRIHGSIPTSSALSVTVPGAAAAWVDIVENFGSGKLPLNQVFAPAIAMAEEGIPISEISSYYWVLAEAELRERPNGIELLKEVPQQDGGASLFKAPRAGEIYRNPRLADTLRRLAKDGSRGFYEGPVAQAVVDVITDLGGYLTLDDMRRHGEDGSEITEPVSIRLGPQFASYGGLDGVTREGEIDLWEHPPNGQGVVAQIALGILQELRKQELIPEFKLEDHNSARYLHAVIQALRIAFADGCWYITDPVASGIDPKSLVSPEYLAERAKLFNPDRATTIENHGKPVHRTSDTIYLAVTDADGNACSLVNSVADTFGSRIVPRGTGFVLHSRGSGFHLDPEHPNAFGPGKRPYNTIIPALVTTPQGGGDGGDAESESGDLHTVLGVMGGAMQPQGHVQVLLNMVMFGMNSQVALDAPRVCIGVSLPGKATDPSKSVDNTVYLEEGISQEVGKELERMGHEVKFVTGMGRSLFGRGQVIRAHRDPVEDRLVYSAGSDMRGDGMAAPLL